MHVFVRIRLAIELQRASSGALAAVRRSLSMGERLSGGFPLPLRELTVWLRTSIFTDPLASDLVVSWACSLHPAWGAQRISKCRLYLCTERFASLCKPLQALKSFDVHLAEAAAQMPSMPHLDAVRLCGAVIAAGLASFSCLAFALIARIARKRLLLLGLSDALAQLLLKLAQGSHQLDVGAGA